MRTQETLSGLRDTPKKMRPTVNSIDTLNNVALLRDFSTADQLGNWQPFSAKSLIDESSFAQGGPHNGYRTLGHDSTVGTLKSWGGTLRKSDLPMLTDEDWDPNHHVVSKKPCMGARLRGSSESCDKFFKHALGDDRHDGEPMQFLNKSESQARDRFLEGTKHSENCGNVILRKATNTTWLKSIARDENGLWESRGNAFKTKPQLKQELCKMQKEQMFRWNRNSNEVFNNRTRSRTRPAGMLYYPDPISTPQMTARPRPLSARPPVKREISFSKLDNSSSRSMSARSKNSMIGQHSCEEQIRAMSCRYSSRDLSNVAPRTLQRTISSAMEKSVTKQVLLENGLRGQTASSSTIGSSHVVGGQSEDILGSDAKASNVVANDQDPYTPPVFDVEAMERKYEELQKMNRSLRSVLAQEQKRGKRTPWTVSSSASHTPGGSSTPVVTHTPSRTSSGANLGTETRQSLSHRPNIYGNMIRSPVKKSRSPMKRLGNLGPVLKRTVQGPRAHEQVDKSNPTLVNTGDAKVIHHQQCDAKLAYHPPSRAASSQQPPSQQQNIVVNSQQTKTVTKNLHADSASLAESVRKVMSERRSLLERNLTQKSASEL